eukprot:3865670-Rhodomonas_salina.2
MWCNYASFLENNRGDVDKAEAIYKQALDLEVLEEEEDGDEEDVRRMEEDGDEDEDDADTEGEDDEDGDNDDDEDGDDEDEDEDAEQEDEENADFVCVCVETHQPNEPAALYNYAIFLEEVRQDHDGAEALYKRVLQVDAADTDALNNYGESTCGLWSLRGLRWSGKGDVLDDDDDDDDDVCVCARRPLAAERAAQLPGSAQALRAGP